MTFVSALIESDWNKKKKKKKLLKLRAVSPCNCHFGLRVIHHHHWTEWCSSKADVAFVYTCAVVSSFLFAFGIWLLSVEESRRLWLRDSLIWSENYLAYTYSTTTTRYRDHQNHTPSIQTLLSSSSHIYIYKRLCCCTKQHSHLFWWHHGIV
jgi:hypothetical protein